MAFTLFRRDARPEATKGSAAGPLMALHGSGRAAWTPRDHVSLTRAGYERNVIGFRAVRMVAEAAAAIPLVLTEEGARLLEHPVLRLMEQPNPGQDGRALIEAVYSTLQLNGECLSGRRRPRHAGGRARAARAARRPDAGGAGARWLARGLRVSGLGVKTHRWEATGESPSDPAPQGLPPAERPLRDEPAGSGGAGGRCPQCRGALVQRRCWTTRPGPPAPSSSRAGTARGP